MNLKEYQEFTRTTVVYRKDLAEPYLIAGLASEVGEVAGLYKKYLRQDYDHNELVFKMKFELGDVCWYLARLCDELGLSLEEILEINADKLRLRQQRNTLRGNGDER